MGGLDGRGGGGPGALGGCRWRLYRGWRSEHRLGKGAWRAFPLQIPHLSPCDFSL